jgi:hypothetical protein
MKSILKIDVDNFGVPDEWVRVRAGAIRDLAKMFWPDCYMSSEWSKSRGMHIRIVVNEYYPPETICEYQYILGDDPFRSAKNLQRIKAGITNWNKLFTRRRPRISKCRA